MIIFYLAFTLAKQSDSFLRCKAVDTFSIHHYVRQRRELVVDSTFSSRCIIIFYK